jgi:hypothetical protein
MTKDEALKLALEALDCICSPLHVREITKVGNAMKAIKEALAQPDQEPVANGIIRTLVSIDKDGIETWKHEPFYTAPPQPEQESDDLTIAYLSGFYDGANKYAPQRNPEVE